MFCFVPLSKVSRTKVKKYAKLSWSLILAPVDMMTVVLSHKKSGKKIGKVTYKKIKRLILRSCLGILVPICDEKYALNLPLF